MARATLKCTKCKQDIPRENITKVGGKNYCPPCLEEKNKPKELTDWDYLYQYLCYLHNTDTLSGLTFKKLKEYRDDYGYTDIGMYYTLKYIHETLEIEFYDNGHISQIPFYYSQAKEHIMKTIEIANLVDEFELKNETTTVTVSNRQAWNPKKPLNLGSVDWSELDED